MTSTVYSLLFLLYVARIFIQETAAACPSACSCDEDRNGKKRVRCDAGGLSIPSGFDPKTIDKDTLVLSIDAPSGASNTVIGLQPDHFKGLALEEIRISNTQMDIIGDRTFYFLSHSMKVLDLRRNKLRMVHENNFRNLSGLTHLYLDDNAIIDIYSAVFNYQRNLQVLSLANNKISAVGSRLLLDQQNLQEIDLSGNPIREVIPGDHQGAIPDSIFPDAPNLRRVSLANTGIQTLPFAGIARACKKLVDLDVSRNNFKFISDGQFNKITSLRRLNLAGNPISSIQPGALRGVNLDFLDLSSTKLQLQPKTFDGANIRHLSIASNNLQTIEPSAFLPIAQDLTAIDIGGNPLTLKERMFEFLPNLAGLSLTGMRLSRLPKDFFGYAHKFTNINISNNMFQDLDSELLASLPDLEVLDVSRNELQSLPIRLAKSSMRELHVSHNKLTKVSDYYVDVFSGSSTFAVLNVFENPLRCDWSVGALANWLSSPTGRKAVCGPDAGYRCPTCAQPQTLRGKTLDAIKVAVS